VNKVSAVGRGGAAQGRAVVAAAALESAEVNAAVATSRAAATQAVRAAENRALLGPRVVGESPGPKAVGSSEASRPPLRVGGFKELNASGKVGDGLTPDHQPSVAALIAAEEAATGKKLSPSERRVLRDNATCIEISGCIHADASRTYKGRNSKSQIAQDKLDLQNAAGMDGEAMRGRLLKEGYTHEEINKAFELRDERNRKLNVY